MYVSLSILTTNVTSKMHDSQGLYNISYGMLGIILIAVTLLMKIIGATTRWSGAPPGIDLGSIFQQMFDSKQGRLHSLYWQPPSAT